MELSATRPPADVRDRVIATCDILGFRDLVMRERDLTKVSALYDAVFRPLDVEVERRSIHYRVFSDSLFVAVENRNVEQQLVDLVLFCRSLISRTILNELPIRGAISFGPLLWRDDIVIGPAIVESVQFSEVHDWIGMTLAPSAARILAAAPNLRARLRDDLVQYDVPIKPSPDVVSALAVVPDAHEAPEWSRITDCLQRISLTAGRVDAQRKCRHSCEFVRHLMKQPSLHAGT